uniref:SAWADEE domain-containing protein n=1 Tax=Cucumis sativus TaxID=3659 RepID=A0A0A0LGL0_CUCSA
MSHHKKINVKVSNNNPKNRLRSNFRQFLSNFGPVSPVMLSVGDSSSGDLEFLSDDDAWYNATVKLEGDVLRVSHCEFSKEHDNVFDADHFQSLLELSVFEARFRPLSRQLQDYECPNVHPGMPVCASYSSRADDVRFYDARLEGHGPNSGNLTIASIANMCQIQFDKINDTVLATFFRNVREKIETRMNRGDICSEDRLPTHNGGGACQKDDCSLKLKHRLSFFERMDQETRRAKRSSGDVEPWEDRQSLSSRKSDVIEQDTDIGGVKYQYMILLENLDKGFSPVKLAKFLYEETLISPRVHIFPSLTFELYARGAVVMNCRRKLKRPLVVTGRIARHETFGTLAAGAMVLDSGNKFGNEKDGRAWELKVVKVGTNEYLNAKHMKELFMEFLSHQRGLHQRLAMEESKIYCNGALQ